MRRCVEAYDSKHDFTDEAEEHSSWRSEADDAHDRLVAVFSDAPGVFAACRHWAKRQPHQVRVVAPSRSNAESIIDAAPQRSIFVMSANDSASAIVLDHFERKLGAIEARLVWLLSSRDTNDKSVSGLCEKVNAHAGSICACVTGTDFLYYSRLILDAVSAGIIPLSEELCRIMCCPSQVEAAPEAPQQCHDMRLLTDREIEVLRLAAKGLKQKEIASVLGRSVHTVSGYFKSVYAKLEVNTRTEAIFEAQEMGYLKSR